MLRQYRLFLVLPQANKAHSQRRGAEERRARRENQIGENSPASVVSLK